MLDILNAIYHDRLPPLLVLSNLGEPKITEEEKIRIQLRVVDKVVEETLIPSIEALADKKAEEDQGYVLKSKLVEFWRTLEATLE